MRTEDAPGPEKRREEMKTLTVNFFQGDKVEQVFESGKAGLTISAAESAMDRGCTAAVYVDGQRVATDCTFEELWNTVIAHGGASRKDILKEL
jgi:hypothetical protein